MSHLVIMAAGTGGHVIPGLAVAREMQRRGWSVSWLGTTHGMENRLVPPSGIPLERIEFSGLRGKGLLHTLGGAFKLLRALGSCRAILRRRGADAVLGMGGYVCFPGGLMAAWLRKPLLLVNADAALLLSNQSLLRFARRVLFGFDGKAAASTRNAVVTGNPVRAEIEALASPQVRYAGRSGPLRLLVVGGSLGARALNEVLPLALKQLPPSLRPQVLHQTGEKNLATVRTAYRMAGIDIDGGAAGVELRPFIDDMAAQLAACDLVLCRAGAGSISELCAAGVASVLVPLIVSTTSHQRDNAGYLTGHGAALHLPQAELTPERLAALLAGLNRDALCAMAVRARALARPQAAARVADEIEKSVAR
jgi:UDP-N-acetylglucosamine--N-acetylmuramyl-(pentapeptide) pyrophosphoryl-undecaprenol N-acetylglucosamine transferase